MALIIAKEIPASSFSPATRGYGCARCVNCLIPGTGFIEYIADASGAPALLSAYCGKCITEAQLQEQRRQEFREAHPRLIEQEWEILARVLGSHKEK